MFKIVDCGAIQKLQVNEKVNFTALWKFWWSIWKDFQSSWL